MPRCLGHHGPVCVTGKFACARATEADGVRVSLSELGLNKTRLHPGRVARSKPAGGAKSGPGPACRALNDWVQDGPAWTTRMPSDSEPAAASFTVVTSSLPRPVPSQSLQSVRLTRIVTVTVRVSGVPGLV